MAMRGNEGRPRRAAGGRALLRRALLPEPALLRDAIRTGALDLEEFLVEVRYAVLDAALAEAGHVAEAAAHLVAMNPHTLRRHLRRRPRRLPAPEPAPPSPGTEPA
ncbi:MAG: hypothetical protein HZA54_03825 [Planctomycetes bacterium]|nr:hypothetical protein [Planctomycetota bacterium]